LGIRKWSSSLFPLLGRGKYPQGRKKYQNLVIVKILANLQENNFLNGNGWMFLGEYVSGTK
jgi:hypothetical protein